ncbi:hypothetical protein [Nocardiopsis sp. NRRL B-16309]|uniref:hypothetical protein n=1 Tax=Nocardiopsis sp. NRRL B-16309 TaxID=1519494 RepID=UPI0006B019F7|nr:hypothetical protein [Nocardiopsis sp. NRRL B-16309]KOX13674.1 hypothetical protein ADL05_18485 [Nocardiopsis sp. NRRL B-16309]
MSDLEDAKDQVRSATSGVTWGGFCDTLADCARYDADLDSLQAALNEARAAVAEARIRAAVWGLWDDAMAAAGVAVRPGDHEKVHEMLTEGLAEAQDGDRGALLHATSGITDLVMNRHAEEQGFVGDPDDPRWDTGSDRGDQVLGVLLDAVRGPAQA